MPWWIVSKKVCVEAPTREEAAKLASTTVDDVKALPYPASPRIASPHASDCPSFCYTPEFCAGGTSCPKGYACSE